MSCVYVMCMHVFAAIYYIVVCFYVLCNAMYCIYEVFVEVSYLAAEPQICSIREYDVIRFTLFELVISIILILLAMNRVKLLSPNVR